MKDKLTAAVLHRQARPSCMQGQQHTRCCAGVCRPGVRSPSVWLRCTSSAAVVQQQRSSGAAAAQQRRSSGAAAVQHWRRTG